MSAYAGDAAAASGAHQHARREDARTERQDPENDEQKIALRVIAVVAAATTIVVVIDRAAPRNATARRVRLGLMTPAPQRMRARPGSHRAVDVPADVHRSQA